MCKTVKNVTWEKFLMTHRITLISESACNKTLEEGRCSINRSKYEEGKNVMKI